MGRRNRAQRWMGGGPARRGGARRKQQLNPQVRKRLSSAHAKAERGEHAAAAAELEDLAGRAINRGREQMAVHLYLAASRQHAQAGAQDTAMAAVHKALAQAKNAPDRQRSARKFAGLVTDLRAHGHEAQADQVEAAAREALGVSKLPSGEGATTVNRSQRRSLPRSCTTCGAPVDAAAAKFEDDGFAGCSYCGVNLFG